MTGGRCLEVVVKTIKILSVIKTPAFQINKIEIFLKSGYRLVDVTFENGFGNVSISTSA